MNFIDNPEINAIADNIEKHLLQHKVDVYKDNASLAGDVAKHARNIKKLVKDDENWLIDPGSKEEQSTEVSDAQVVESVTPEFTNEPEQPPPTQAEKDMDFLASLSQEDSPTPGNVPDFDIDDML